MDERLLRLYERELSFLREAGAEFGSDYPKVASLLGMLPEQTTDPWVERLLEGLGFLTARVQLQMEAEFPQFTENLLELIQPHFLLPVPSMAVLQFSPDLQEGSLANGFELPADTALRSMPDPRSDNPRCEFRTTRALHLWPVQLESAEYLPSIGMMKHLPPLLAEQAACAVRLRFRSTAGQRFNQLALEELPLFLRGDDSLPLILHEALLSHALGMLVRSGEGDAPWAPLIEPECIFQPGQSASQAARYPRSLHSDSTFAQLKKFLAFPEAERFVTLGGLGPAIGHCDSDCLELIILFPRLSTALPGRLDASSFALFCTPAINLFNKRADRIAYQPERQEMPVVVDTSRPLAHEVHEVLSVYGYATGSRERQWLAPLYSPHSGVLDEGRPAGFYQIHRAPHRAAGRALAGRPGYQGTESSIALTLAPQAGQAPPRQLALEVLCSNRDLPMHLPLGLGNTDFVVQDGAPVLAIRCVAGPSRPVPAPSAGGQPWQVLSQLSRNYLPLATADGQAGAKALRELLALYVPADDSVGRKLLHAIHSVRAEAITRRLPGHGPVAFGRGLKLLLILDESACEGVGCYVFGAVLERFFCRYGALNSFTETELHSLRRGHLKTWQARASQCITL